MLTFLFLFFYLIGKIVCLAFQTDKLKRFVTYFFVFVIFAFIWQKKAIHVLLSCLKTPPRKANRNEPKITLLTHRKKYREIVYETG